METVLGSQDTGPIRYVAYADDLAIIGKSRVDLQVSLSNLQSACRKAGMNISVPKTKYMEWNLRNPDMDSVKVDGDPIERMDRFEYLGCFLSQENNLTIQVRRNCDKVRTALVKLRPALTSKRLSIRLKSQLLEVFIKPILLYAMETSVTREIDLNKINAVIHKGKRMILKLNSEKQLSLQRINEKVTGKPVHVEFSATRLNLYRSF